MTDNAKETTGDTLQQLEDLLSNDVMSSDPDDDSLISKGELRSIIIRLSVLLVLSLVLYFVGVFESILILLAAVGILVLLEGINVLKLMKAGKRRRDDPMRSLRSRR
ncbi:MAG: hypothetical protein GY765_20135 [bacterium]|nr:hypothetical protein [bacterium]